MKKLLSVIMSVVLVATLFVGCSSDSSKVNSSLEEYGVEESGEVQKKSKSDEYTYIVTGMQNCAGSETITVSKDTLIDTKCKLTFTCPRCYSKEEVLFDFPEEALGQELYNYVGTNGCLSHDLDGDGMPDDDYTNTCYWTSFEYSYTVQFQMA